MTRKRLLTNNHLEKMKKTEMTIKDLFQFLDWFYFVEEGEITMAVNDFFRDYVEKDKHYQASYWELIYFQELAEMYQKEKNLTFNS